MTWLVDAIVSALPDRIRRRCYERELVRIWLGGK
jgi:hypothetical protein